MRRLFSPWAIVAYFLFCLLMAVWYTSETSKQTRDLVALVAALVTGGAAIYGFLLNVQTLRASSAGRFIERWNDPQMREMRESMRRVNKAHLVEPNGEPADRNRANAEVANFFEELAILVLHNGADTHLLKDFFRSPLCDAYRDREEWIAEMRGIMAQPTACEHFEKLFRKWSKLPWWQRLDVRCLFSLMPNKPLWRHGVLLRHHK